MISATLGKRQKNESLGCLMEKEPRRLFDTEQTFQAASILAAISVPLLSAVASFEPLASNQLLVRSIAVSGFLFLLAAIFAFMELMEVAQFPEMTVATAFRKLVSSKGAKCQQGIGTANPSSSHWQPRLHISSERECRKSIFLTKFSPS